LATSVKLFGEIESRKFGKIAIHTDIGAPPPSGALEFTLSLGEASSAAWVSVPSEQAKAWTPTASRHFCVLPFVGKKSSREVTKT
jgi:hypothetical protein